MNRTSSIAGSLAFLLVAPGTVAVYGPWLISRWQMQTPLPHYAAFRILGVLLIIMGIPALLDSFARFALQGLGTPAPILPTKHLVVSGLYRYVRNPMYLGVAAAIFGQGILLGDVRVLEYGSAVWLAFHLFVLLYEEPKLRSAFKEEYDRFCVDVPRWIPRMHPWRTGIM